jgi:methionyl-tRNA formyltransferase
MKILCFGYRQWSLDIFSNLIERMGNQHEFQVMHKPDAATEELFASAKADIALFYGWSWIIPESIIEKHPCYCLHPSPLPKFRGGSPIQNQLIEGKTEGAVSIFRMTNKLDAGPIAYQKNISLAGYLDQILLRITSAGIEGSIHLMEQLQHGTLKLTQQDEACATYVNRRKPQDSQILPSHFSEHEAIWFYNLVRGLQAPYPEAYIMCKNNTKLSLRNVDHGK